MLTSQLIHIDFDLFMTLKSTQFIGSSRVIHLSVYENFPNTNVSTFSYPD